MLKPSAADIKYMKKENKKYPAELIKLDMANWVHLRTNPMPCQVWRSKKFMVQVFNSEPVIRLSINKTSLKNNGRWADKITWDKLQELKNQCGFSGFCAVEIYPPDKHVINDANMRHLWVLDSPPFFMWKQ